MLSLIRRLVPPAWIEHAAHGLGIHCSIHWATGASVEIGFSRLWIWPWESSYIFETFKYVKIIFVWALEPVSSLIRRLGGLNKARRVNLRSVDPIWKLIRIDCVIISMPSGMSAKIYIYIERLLLTLSVLCYKITWIDLKMEKIRFLLLSCISLGMLRKPKNW